MKVSVSEMIRQVKTKNPNLKADDVVAAVKKEFGKVIKVSNVYAFNTKHNKKGMVAPTQNNGEQEIDLLSMDKGALVMLLQEKEAENIRLKMAINVLTRV